MVVAYSYCGLFLEHNRLQSSANEIALVGAKKLNENDRLGQMNNMISLCRQLVYFSRNDYEKTKREFANLESFAEPLLKESRESAARLESERKSLSDTARRESQRAMQEKFDSIKGTYVMALPWLKISSAQLSLLKFGKINGLESNVEELSKNKALASEDRSKSYLDLSPLAGGSSPTGLNLYKAETDHKLSGQDSDLPFKLSCLPAPVNGVISPTRILLGRAFKENLPNSDYAPAATHVLLRLQVETGLGPSASSVMEAEGTAITTGASSQI